MLIVGNWKAYITSPEMAKKLLATAKRMVGKTRKVKIVLAPSAPHLGLLLTGKRSKVLFAAQDMSDTTVTAATGEVAAPLLRSLGVSYVILGHSERRAKGETDALIGSKVKRALANGLIPILCIGETERDSDARYLSVLKSQIGAVYADLAPKDRLNIVIAYEPVWAIGKSSLDAINANDLAEMVLYIRKLLSQYLPGKSATKVSILYGGSVTPENIRDIAAGTGVDGFLVGRASTEPVSLTELAKALS